jgi:hypothetical protein
MTKMRDLTQEQKQEIEQKIDNRLYYSDKYAIRELIQNDPYALYYFVDVALDNIRTLRQIKDIFNI